MVRSNSVYLTGIIIFAMISIIILQPVNAYSKDNYTNDPNTLDWSIIFVTSGNQCSNNNIKALNFYSKLTQDYLNQYGFANSPFFASCIVKDDMPKTVKYMTDNGDLTITIPDFIISRHYTHSSDALGHYSTWDAHTIVSNAQTLSIGDKETVWTLSHELAHFSMSWKGYNFDIMEKSVHMVQAKYNFCKSNDITETSCTILWDVIKTSSGKSFPVMSPDYTIQIAESMMPPPKEIFITVYTPKFTHDNNITVNGVIQNYDDKSPLTAVSYTVTSPSNSFVSIGQSAIRPDGSFKFNLSMEGNTWNEFGVYPIKIMYNSKSVSVSIELSKPVKIPSYTESPMIKCGTNQVFVNGFCQTLETTKNEPIIQEPTCRTGQVLINNICQMISNNVDSNQQEDTRSLTSNEQRYLDERQEQIDEFDAYVPEQIDESKIDIIDNFYTPEQLEIQQDKQEQEDVKESSDVESKFCFWFWCW